MASIEELASQTETAEVVKTEIPKIMGARRPVTLYLEHGGQCFAGHIVESQVPYKLIHDFKISGLHISHVAALKLVGPDIFELATLFAHAKQNPLADPVFFGRLTRDAESYHGSITVQHSGNEFTHYWDIVLE